MNLVTLGRASMGGRAGGRPLPRSHSGHGPERVNGRLRDARYDAIMTVVINNGRRMKELPLGCTRTHNAPTTTPLKFSRSRQDNRVYRFSRWWKPQRPWTLPAHSSPFSETMPQNCLRANRARWSLQIRLPHKSIVVSPSLKWLLPVSRDRGVTSSSGIQLLASPLVLLLRPHAPPPPSQPHCRGWPQRPPPGDATTRRTALKVVPSVARTSGATRDLWRSSSREVVYL